MALISLSKGERDILKHLAQQKLKWGFKKIALIDVHSFQPLPWGICFKISRILVLKMVKNRFQQLKTKMRLIRI
jgi:hypothetical protein